MKGHAHTLSGVAAWLGGCVLWEQHVGPVTAATAAAGAVVAGGYAIWPDMDTDGTAARSLGWPTMAAANAAQWLVKHRGATHWLSTNLAVAAAIHLYGATWWALQMTVLVLGVAWCQAGFDADDAPRKRLRVRWRWALALAVSGAIVVLDPGTAWLGPAVLVGGLAHLAGDALTSERWALLAPLTFRKFGGLGVIPPSRRGQRVSGVERVLETAMFAGACAAALTLTVPGWTTTAGQYLAQIGA